MKKLLSLFAFVFLLATAEMNSQSLSLSPEQAKPGTTITINYNPAETPLAGIAEFDAVAYLMKGEVPNAVEVELTKEGDHYTGSLATDEDTKAVFFKFSYGDAEKVDNNNNEGYGYMLYGEAGKPVQGAYGEMAKAHGSNSYFVGLESRMPEKEVAYWEKEFAMYPESKSDNMYPYAYASNKAEHKDGIMAAKKMIDELSKNDNEDDVMKVASLYSALGNREKATDMRTMAAEKFPEGKTAKRNFINSYYGAENVEEKIKLLADVKEKYGEDEGIESSISRIASSIASDYAKAEDWENFEKYVAMMNTNQSKAGLFNNLAWGMSGESLDGEGKNVKFGKEISAKSLKLVKADIENIEEVKPPYFTKREYKKNLKYSYAMYADTYALLAYKDGDAKDALEHQEIACKVNKWEDAEMNERYAAYYEAEKGGAETTTLLEHFIQSGAASSRVKEQYKRLFMEHYTMDVVYDKYVGELEKEATKKMKADLKKKMTEDDAPDFTLVNLDGEQVTLSEMKGKIVILDFWAIWCGPCKASFPGMQKAVDKYANNEKVEFLFIDTWENAKDAETKAKNAREFIEGKKYTFNVLMDNDDKVVGAYGVSGIPTKFIIGPEGKIRFKSTGFGGNDDELVKELTLMIEMAEAASTKDLPGAP